jgi:hypothetical protein
MDTADGKRPDARSQAEDRFAKILKRDAEVKAYQQQQWDAEAAKIAKLRALRLAKQAEEPKPRPGRRAKAATAVNAEPTREKA